MNHFNPPRTYRINVQGEWWERFVERNSFRGLCQGRIETHRPKSRDGRFM